MTEQYFFEKKKKFLNKYETEHIDEILCQDIFGFPIDLDLMYNEFFAGIIVDNKIQLIVKYKLDHVKYKLDVIDPSSSISHIYDIIALNYLYQKHLIDSKYNIIKDDIEKLEKFIIKYIQITHICAAKGFGTKFLDKMENYYLPDIIVVKGPMPSALNFYYKNNFKTNFMTVDLKKSNCTFGALIFKVPSYSPNIYSKINNKLKFNSINDLTKENIKKLYIENNYQHSLFQMEL